MSTKLSDCINIGKDTESKLIRVGIDSIEKLQMLGTEQAFLRLQALDAGACINLLYALEGAVQGIKSSQISNERKQSLLQFHKMSRKLLG